MREPLVVAIFVNRDTNVSCAERFEVFLSTALVRGPPCGMLQSQLA